MLGFITTQGEHYAAQAQKIRDARSKIHELRFSEKVSIYIFKTETATLRMQRGFHNLTDSLMLAARAVSDAITLANEVKSIRQLKNKPFESAAVFVHDNNSFVPPIINKP